MDQNWVDELSDCSVDQAKELHISLCFLFIYSTILQGFDFFFLQVQLYSHPMHTWEDEVPE